MDAEEPRAELRYEDRCEGIRYRLGNRSLLAYCTHGGDPRLFATSVTKWEQPNTAISAEDRLRIIREILSWMTEPRLFRRLFCLARIPVTLVVDDQDPQRSELEGLCDRLAPEGIRIRIEHDSLQRRKDRFDAMTLSLLRTGRGSILINGKKVCSPEEYLANADRHKGFVK